MLGGAEFEYLELFIVWIWVFFIYFVPILDLKCKGFVDKHNLDLIVVVERIKDQMFHTRLKTQLAHLVEMICARDYNFRLALVCYQDHSLCFPNANTWWFAKEKDVMKSQIHFLNESRTAPSANGLADGLALVRDLATKKDSRSCRKDANKICILLRKYNCMMERCGELNS